MQASGGSSEGRPSAVATEVARLKTAANAARSRSERLQNLDPKVLDISLCTVLDSTAIPTEDKLHAFELIKSCGE